MKEQDSKKKKITLTVSSKKPYNIPSYTQGKQKRSFVIEKKISRRGSDRNFYNRENNYSKSSSKFAGKPKAPLSNDFLQKKSSPNRNFEIRKMAEERATKRFKNLKEDISQSKKSNLGKSKGSTSKREYKLTLSKALDDEALEGKERSLASVRRARLYYLRGLSGRAARIKEDRS